MSVTGQFTGKIIDVGEDRSPAGPYIGIQIEVPQIKESLERRLYFGSEKAKDIAKRILSGLGVDVKRPPMPQLRKLVGKSAQVRTRAKVWEGIERTEVVDIWLGTAPSKSVGAEIHAALGIDAPEEEEDEQEKSEFDDVEPEPAPRVAAKPHKPVTPVPPPKPRPGEAEFDAAFDDLAAEKG